MDLFEVSVKQEFTAACLLANSHPFLSHRTEEEEEEEEGKQAGICCLCNKLSSYKQSLCPLA